MAEPDKKILDEATADALFKDIVAQAKELSLKRSVDYTTRTLTFPRYDDIKHTQSWAERWNKEVGFEALKVTADNKVTYTIQPGQDEKSVRCFHQLFNSVISRGRFSDLVPPKNSEPKTDYEKAVVLVENSTTASDHAKKSRQLIELIKKGDFTQDQIDSLFRIAVEHGGYPTTTALSSFLPLLIDPRTTEAIGKKPNIHMVDPDTGDTLLHIAARTESHALVSYLLEIGVKPDIRNKANELPEDIAIKRLKTMSGKPSDIEEITIVQPNHFIVEDLQDARQHPEKYPRPPNLMLSPLMGDVFPAANEKSEKENATTAPAAQPGNEDAGKKAPPENPGNGDDGKGDKNFLESLSPEMAGGGIGLVALAAGLLSGMDFFMALILAALAGVAAKFGMEYMAKQKESAAPDPNTGAAVAQPEINQGAALSRQRDFDGLASPENRLAVSDLPPPDQFRPTGGIPGAANGRVRG